IVLRRRRDLGRLPRRVGGGGGIPVVRGGADRGGRAPEVVVLLRIPAGDVPVGENHVQEREKTRRLREIDVAGGGRRARNAVPTDVRKLPPELGIRTLVSGARAAALAAEGLHLVESGGIGSAGERGRRRYAQLLRALQREGADMTPARRDYQGQ